MSRVNNYSAFYVSEPFDPSSLGAYATHDFCHYQMLKAWKGKDSSFPFYNAHETTYNVRDNSNWEQTLKPRLRERLRNSKNIILFLSAKTKNSRALREEIDYGVNVLKLPIIVVYPEFTTYDQLLTATGSFKNEVSKLWGNLPIFNDSKKNIPVLHVPLNKSLINNALLNKGFTIQTPLEPKDYIL